MPFAEINTGARLFYEHHNLGVDGIPVVAVHGRLGTGRIDLGHVIDWLAEEGYEVFAPTLRGYGQSEPKPRDFPMRFYDRDAADLLAFMQALEIEQAHLLGYSDGGETVLIAAGKKPDSAVSVSVWGALGYFGSDLRPTVQAQIPGSAWMTADDMALHDIPDADEFARQWVRAMVQMIDSGGDVAVSLAPYISARLLMMLGTEDTLNPAAYAERFLAGVQNGRLQIFDCGHGIHDEQTAAFREAVLAHLQQTE